MFAAEEALMRVAVLAMLLFVVVSYLKLEASKELWFLIALGCTSRGADRNFALGRWEFRTGPGFRACALR